MCDASTVGKENLSSSPLYIYIYIYVLPFLLQEQRGVGTADDGFWEVKKIVRSKLQFVEKKSVCRVRFVPLTRRSLVQASNSRRARERIAFSFVHLYARLASIF